MGKLIIEDSGETFEIPDEGRIEEACEEAGVPFACTEGVCGTCVIEVKEGMENLSKFTQEEEDFLGEMEEERLACQCVLMKDEIKITFQVCHDYEQDDHCRDL